MWLCCRMHTGDAMVRVSSGISIGEVPIVFASLQTSVSTRWGNPAVRAESHSTIRDPRY